MILRLLLCRIPMRQFLRPQMALAVVIQPLARQRPRRRPVPAPPPTAPTTPYGVKVPGKPGFVYSPFDKTAGVVDVQGMAPGTKVKCPYTGKVFIVP